MKKTWMLMSVSALALVSFSALADDSKAERAAEKTAEKTGRAAEKTADKTGRAAEKTADKTKASAEKFDAKVEKAADKAETKADKAADDVKDESDGKKDDDAAPRSKAGSYEGSYSKDKDNYGKQESKSVNEDAERGMAKLENDAKDEGRAKQERRDRNANPQGVSIAGHVGYGTADAYQMGVGIRAGYTFRNRVYVGGSSFYHFGRKTTVEDISTEHRIGYVGPEVGYDVAAGPFLIRPVVGFGVGFIGQSVKSTDGGIDRDDNKYFQPYLAPGASVIYPIGDFFVGGDARGMFISDASGLTLYGTVGYHL